MANKCVLLFALACCVALAAASPLDFDVYEPLTQDLEAQDLEVQNFEAAPILVRQARSPQHGSVGVEYGQDQNGKRGSVEYNHNLHTSSDGRFKVDAYGQASRDFTHNRNDYGGGVRGSWRF